ncbi:MAG TPA: hypothetical protein DCY48_01200 [Candidatus Magasanikbacteria bacterium]|nr:hypothetical protein [Candidatus Magasanikbacteria bacterium]
MNKDFQNWHTRKKMIHEQYVRVFFKEREIWFSFLGQNIGYEQDGRGFEFLRPVVIFKKFNNSVLWVIPLTKQTKEGIHYFSFFFFPRIRSTAVLSQLRLIDAKRLKYKVGNMKTEDFNSLKNKIRQLLPD